MSRVYFVPMWNGDGPLERERVTLRGVEVGIVRPFAFEIPKGTTPIDEAQLLSQFVELISIGKESE